MSLLYFCLVIGLLWLHLTGVGVILWPATRNYAIARIGGLLIGCLVLFFIEHFIGLGSHLPFLPFTSLLAAWIIWKKKALLQENWPVEAAFAAGFFYCLLWRFLFPDIDAISERVGNLAFIEGYMTGQTLPPPDRWLPPYRGNFYYSFQHYGASLLGRWLWVAPGMAYHLAFCTIAGLISCASFAAASFWCPWKWGRRLVLLTLLIGGSGAMVVIHAMVTRVPNLLDCVRFVGGTTAHGDLNALGLKIQHAMAIPGIDPRDLPMEPLSYILFNGDYHPPLSGYVLLTFAVLLIAALENGATGRQRALFHGLLGATISLALICNTWVFPLQGLLVFGWMLYRAFQGERNHWLAILVGAGAATMLEYPYLRELMTQATLNKASICWTQPEDRTPWLGWILTFWPVTGILLLALCDRERRAWGVFLVIFWGALLAGTEFWHNDDLYGGTEERFNTTMKWWPWVYAGIVLTAGSFNLGSVSRFCRWGTMAFLLPTTIFALTLCRQVGWSDLHAAGQMNGAAWLERDPVIKDLLTVLGAEPDGITLESGLKLENTEAPAIALFSGKICFLGWPEHETTWRGPLPEIYQRMRDVDLFYDGKMDDPLGWLLKNQIRYVTWLPRDNRDGNNRFRPLFEQLKSRYRWEAVGGENDSFTVGFWALQD